MLAIIPLNQMNREIGDLGSLKYLTKFRCVYFKGLLIPEHSDGPRVGVKRNNVGRCNVNLDHGDWSVLRPGSWATVT